MERTRAYLGLTIAMVLWGGSFVATKIALAVYPPFTVIFGRMIIASLIFLLLWKRVVPEYWLWKDLKYLLAMAFMEPCLYFLFEGYALKYTTAGQASLIVSTLPLMVGMSAAFLLGEELKPRMVLGFLISILGVFFLTRGAAISEASPNPILGNTLEFLAMVAATVYTLLVRYMSSKYSALFLTAIQSFVGLLFFGPLAFFHDKFYHLRPQIYALSSIMFLGAFVTVIAYWLYNHGIARISASKAAAFGNMIPVFTIFIGWMILGEVLNMAQIGASFLIFFGVVLSQDMGFVSFFKLLSGKINFARFVVK